MSRMVSTREIEPPSESRVATNGTRALLRCGVVAGPLFLTVSLIQAFTREGFDLRRHPLSLLSLGDLGWIQITNFAVTGLLYLACAVGIRRVLRPGRSSTWGPLLVGLLGVGLIMAGVFVTDAGAGFPPGAPAGAPKMSWHGILHDAGAVLAIDGMIIGSLVFVRRFAALKQWRWVVGCVATAAAALVVGSWPDLDTISVRLVIVTAIVFGFVAALAAHLMQGAPDRGTHSWLAARRGRPFARLNAIDHGPHTANGRKET
jgi:hypothetical protein